MSEQGRTANLSRRTQETEIEVDLNVDGCGNVTVQTGIGFFDHMLASFAFHAGFDLKLTARGDLHVDAHHTVEDVGIVLGQALDRALGEKRGIVRFGSALLPMDDALVKVAVDLSGRPYLVWKVPIGVERIGELPAELLEEFWRAFATHAGANVHVVLEHGSNAHHIAEAAFKGVGRAVRTAVAQDPGLRTVPSLKGTLS